MVNINISNQNLYPQNLNQPSLNNSQNIFNQTQVSNFTPLHILLQFTNLFLSIHKQNHHCNYYYLVNGHNFLAMDYILLNSNIKMCLQTLYQIKLFHPFLIFPLISMPQKLTSFIYQGLNYCKFLLFNQYQFPHSF